MQRPSRRVFLVPLVACALCVAGCADKAGVAPAAPTASVPASSPTGVSSEVGAMTSPSGTELPGCYSVQFRAQGSQGVSNLTLSGDLEGTVKYTFGASFPAGVTFHAKGRAEWAITGGIVPGLTAFHTAVMHKNFPWKDTPQSPSTVFEQIGTHSTNWDWVAPGPNGVSMANLSYKGTTVVNSPTDRFTDYRFWGVICP